MRPSSCKVDREILKGPEPDARPAEGKLPGICRRVRSPRPHWEPRGLEDPMDPHIPVEQAVLIWISQYVAVELPVLSLPESGNRPARQPERAPVHHLPEAGKLPGRLYIPSACR